MQFKEFRSKLKNELKELARDVHSKKSLRCKDNGGFVRGLSSAQEDFRVKHIAYCLLRGTHYEKIESRHRDKDNPIHLWCKKKAEELVTLYKEQITEEQDVEAVCTSA